jgi:hypothetical protein
VPVEAVQCPGCGSILAVTTAAPVLENGSPQHATVTNLPTRPIVLFLVAGVALIAVAVTILILSLQH